MLRQAVYERNGRSASITVERIDTWFETSDSVINFPGLVELDGDNLLLTYHRGRHGGHEPLQIALSDDAGATWREAPSDHPLVYVHPETDRNGLDFASGVVGHPRDGSIVNIDHDTVELAQRWKDRTSGSYHEVGQVESPTFIWRRWSKEGHPLEKHTFKVRGLPFARASYQSYSSLLELDNGDYLTALEWVDILPEDEWTTDSRGRVRNSRIGVFIVRSSDQGYNWDFVTKFDAGEINPVYGPGDRAVDEGFDEADLSFTASGDILCVMRTGSYSPMFQSRSSDGGHTWSTPTNTGWQAVKPRLTLLPNGVLACASGRGAYGHPQITHVMLSLDGSGEHWEAPFAFHTRGGCSYTSKMYRDDRLHVVYSDSDFTRDLGTIGLPSQRICRAVIDVQSPAP